MVLIRSLLLALLVALAALSAANPAAAHEKRQHRQQEAVQAPPPGMTPGAVHERMEEQMESHVEAMEEAAPRTFPQRVMSWLGRTHPFAVHFPIALFPVSLVALILVRRRGDSVELIRAFVIVAGAASVVAAALGWLSAGFVLTDPDPVQLWHRWIGTALGAVGGGARTLGLQAPRGGEQRRHGGGAVDHHARAARAGLARRRPCSRHEPHGFLRGIVRGGSSVTSKRRWL